MSVNNHSIKLKKDYVTYFADVPIQKYAAMSVGRDEDTIIRWRREDPDFADAIQRAKASWVRKRVLATKAEFALERLERDIFSPKLNLEPDPTMQSTEDKIRDFLDDKSDLPIANDSLKNI